MKSQHDSFIWPRTSGNMGLSSKGELTTPILLSRHYIFPRRYPFYCSEDIIQILYLVLKKEFPNVNEFKNQM